MMEAGLDSSGSVAADWRLEVLETLWRAPLKNITFLGDKLTIRSSLKEDQLAALDALADALAQSMGVREAAAAPAPAQVENAALFKLSYGLFVLTARDGAKDNGCIINTAAQVTSTPLRISIAVNKANYTHDMIAKTGAFNLSVLSESTPFRVFQQFGFQSGRNVEKLAGDAPRMENGIAYLGEHANAVLSGRVVSAVDCGTHTIFIADVTEAHVLKAHIPPDLSKLNCVLRVRPLLRLVYQAEYPLRSREGRLEFAPYVCGLVYGA